MVYRFHVNSCSRPCKCEGWACPCHYTFFCLQAASSAKVPTLYWRWTLMPPIHPCKGLTLFTVQEPFDFCFVFFCGTSQLVGPYFSDLRDWTQAMAVNSDGSDDKESACNGGDLGLIPGSGRSPGEENWQPTPVFLPGESHGQRSLAGCSPWGRKESDMTKRLTYSLS